MKKRNQGRKNWEKDKQEKDKSKDTKPSFKHGEKSLPVKSKPVSSKPKEEIKSDGKDGKGKTRNEEKDNDQDRHKKSLTGKTPMRSKLGEKSRPTTSREKKSEEKKPEDKRELKALLQTMNTGFGPYSSMYDRVKQRSCKERSQDKILKSTGERSESLKKFKVSDNICCLYILQFPYNS